MDFLFSSNSWVYYVAVFLCAFTAIIEFAVEDKYTIVGIGEIAEIQNRRKNIVKFIAFILIGYIVFWAAVRNGVADTRVYIQSYNLLKSDVGIFDSFIRNDDGSLDKAPLFISYQILLKKLGFDWHFFLGSIAVFSGLCIYYGISKFSDNVSYSVFLFITSLEFYWLFNGIRQFVVAAMFFAAFRLVVEKKFIKFLLLVFVMCFIHSTAIILIPIYFIVNMKNWDIGISTCIIVTMAIVLIFSGKVNVWIDDAFSDYDYLNAVQDDDGVNILRVAVSLVTPVLAYIYRKDIARYNNPYINVMVNFSLITAGLYAVGYVTSGIYIGRLPIYTELFNILLLPFIICCVSSKKIRPILIFCSIVGYLLFFYLQTKDGSMYYTTDLFDSMNMAKDINLFE